MKEIASLSDVAEKPFKERVCNFGDKKNDVTKNCQFLFLFVPIKS
jgi:hypothetical protein